MLAVQSTRAMQGQMLVDSATRLTQVKLHAAARADTLDDEDVLYFHNHITQRRE